MKNKLIKIISLIMILSMIFCTYSMANNNGEIQVKLTGEYYYDFAKSVLKLVNEERAKENLSPLIMDEGLLEAANQRAAETAVYYSHTRPNDTSCFTIFPDGWTTCGENIAMGYTTPESVMNAWMNSAGHKANILNSNFTTIGISAFYHNGVFSWVQCFTDNGTEITSYPVNETKQMTVPVTSNKIKYSDCECICDTPMNDKIKLKVGNETTPKIYGLHNSEDNYSKFILNNETFNWESKDTKTATVNSQGKITAVASGTTTVTATIGETTITYTVNVESKAVENVKNITVSSSSGKVGEKVTVDIKTTADISVGSAGVLLKYDKTKLKFVEAKNSAIQSMTITSQDRTDGVIVKMVAEANNTPIAKDTVVSSVSFEILDGATGDLELNLVQDPAGTSLATAKVTVNKDVENEKLDKIPLTGVALNKTELLLIKGNSETLEIIKEPVNATDEMTKIEWKSSDSKVATVENGKVTAVKAGTANIILTVNDEFNAQVKVIVTEKTNVDEDDNEKQPAIVPSPDSSKDEPEKEQKEEPKDDSKENSKEDSKGEEVKEPAIPNMGDINIVLMVVLLVISSSCIVFITVRKIRNYKK